MRIWGASAKVGDVVVVINRAASKANGGRSVPEDRRRRSFIAICRAAVSNKVNDVRSRARAGKRSRLMGQDDLAGRRAHRDRASCVRRWQVGGSARPNGLLNKVVAARLDGAT